MTLSQVFEFARINGIRVQEYYHADEMRGYLTLVVYSRYAPWGTHVDLPEAEDYPMEDIKALVERIHADLDHMAPAGDE